MGREKKKKTTTRSYMVLSLPLSLPLLLASLNTFTRVFRVSASYVSSEDLEAEVRGIICMIVMANSPGFL
ncbi:hypothetical protein CKAN_00309300 [Cinnamomum micranthum f. kanehirae]|uniref:Uncharacterized protein n=1 Tax=Cinnamomum micranthum f. kanehirae TaxID=337451 RepID=A0A443N8B6_9MAGN|nr:hypothetical protein CKAN_00309300 [Cinnamomum micranthum f. kanehirae]